MVLYILLRQFIIWETFSSCLYISFSSTVSMKKEVAVAASMRSYSNTRCTMSHGSLLFSVISNTRRYLTNTHYTFRLIYILIILKSRHPTRCRMVSDTSQCHLKPNHDTSDAPGCTVVYQVMISNLSGQHVPDKSRSSGIKYCIAGHHKAP